MLKDYFSENVLNNNNKNLYDFCINWLIILYLKIDQYDDIVLDLIFENVLNTKHLKLDKKNQFEDNPYFKILRLKNDCGETMNKINYLIEQFEKRIQNMMNEKTADKKMKAKLRVLMENELKIFGRLIYDYYIIIISNKIKINPSRFEIDLEGLRIKMLMKIKVFDAYNYFREYLYLCFNTNANLIMRKTLLFIFIILSQINGCTFLTKFINHLDEVIRTRVDFIKILSTLDFSLLYENANYCYMYLDSNSGYLKLIETILYELIRTDNIKTAKVSEDMVYLKIVERYKMLSSFIILLENFIHFVTLNSNNLKNITLDSIYSFYYNIQLMVLYFNNSVSDHL